MILPDVIICCQSTNKWLLLSRSWNLTYLNCFLLFYYAILFELLISQCLIHNTCTIIKAELRSFLNITCSIHHQHIILIFTSNIVVSMMIKEWPKAEKWTLASDPVFHIFNTHFGCFDEIVKTVVLSNLQKVFVLYLRDFILFICVRYKYI